MQGYIQRFPFSPKATWFKRYTDYSTLGKRTIYVATDTVGYEIDGFPQGFVQRKLFKGKFNTDAEVEYINITSQESGSVKASAAVKFIERFYIFNPEINQIEEHDIVDEGLQIITAELPVVIHLDKNAYLRKFKFDCVEIGDVNQTEGNPLSGLRTPEQTRVLKTYNFQDESPDKSIQPDDLIVYEGNLYIVQEIQWHYTYTPKRQRIFEFSMVKVR